MALAPGTSYDIQGPADLLDDNQTWALFFNSNQAHPSPRMLPAPTENPILVTSIGTLLATEYAVAPNDHNWILLILTVENLLQPNAALSMKYSIRPDHLTAFFARSLSPGRKIQLSGELTPWDTSLGTFNIDLKATEIIEDNIL
ncbi:hypothetical protein PCANC_15253 [Puccinia coronata f. sp. avenae]|uniref:Uncharacterized protein n=1 Tax=Puccinia coronata f. sp. avenae TaxID=200324 RepID=A0A2N5VNM5_9BASI|nr:hypothetical protein PCANC_15253 [Puccinia coronata f. sp. avenae]